MNATSRNVEERGAFRRIVKRLGHSHGVMMGLCVVAMGAVWLLPVVGVTVGTGGIVLVIAACVGLHLTMMRTMHRHEQSPRGETADERGDIGSDVSQRTQIGPSPKQLIDDSKQL